MIPIKTLNENLIKKSICVDSYYSSRYKTIGIKAIETSTGKELFNQHFINVKASINISKSFALIAALQYCNQNSINLPIYTDSTVAKTWVYNKSINVHAQINVNTQSLVDKLNTIIKNKIFSNKILQWNSKKWGRIPSSFFK